MTIETKKDLNWINAVKALCMISIYIIHGQSYYDYWIGSVNVFIHPIYVNTFFFVSGYLLFKKQLSFPSVGEPIKIFLRNGGAGGRFLTNIFFRLWLPCIIFSMVEYLPKKVIKTGVIGDFGDFVFETLGGGTYWFVSALIICELFVFLLLLTRIRNIWFYVLVLSFFTYVGIDGCLNNGVNYYAYQQALLACVFIATGGLYWKYESLIDSIKPYIWHFTLMIYICIFILIPERARVLISLNDINLLGIVSSILGCLLLIWTCKLLPELRLLTFIGKKSILFYFMSGAIPVCFNAIFKRYISVPSLFDLLVYLVVTILAALVISYVIDRFFTPILDLRKIKRNK